MIHLRHASIEWTDYGCLSRFKDGTEVGAWPHWDDKSYHIITDRVGCGFDLLLYCRSHDLLHHLCAEWLHDKSSPIMWGIAHGAELTGPESAQEEAMVQAMQAFIFAGQRPILSGLPDLDRWKAEALAMIATEDRAFGKVAA